MKRSDPCGGSRPCAACGAGPLTPHLRVAGEMGADGLAPTTLSFGSALSDIARCSRCGHMQLDPMPDESTLREAYAEAASEDYVGEEAGQRETARRALAQIERHAGAPGRIADLGCWVGFLLAEARDRGWNGIGVEPSTFASEFARQRLGLDVITGQLLSTPLPESSFDAVVMGDVIEHLIDPGGAVDRIRELLAPRGVLWLALPDAGSGVARALRSRWWSVIPTHVQYFTRASLETLLRRHGFELLEVSTAPKVFTVDYYADRLSGYSPALGRGTRRAVRALGVADRMWAPDLRDRMAVVARVH